MRVRFEGDGMVHATRIKDGVASYCNHWVRTHKLAEEQRAKFPIYAKVMCHMGWHCWACLFQLHMTLTCLLAASSFGSQRALQV